jgi:ApbE superfamily uncharacterized protein (UPF0280 family)
LNPDRSYALTAASRNRKKQPFSYRHRRYRQLLDPAGLVSFEVKVRESDLHFLASEDRRREALHHLLQFRNQLENYIRTHPLFLTTLNPLPADPLAPPLVKAMLAGAAAAGVGPMAAVAGAIAEFTGKALLAGGVKEVMVENGGDIFLMRARECLLSIFAGPSPLSNKVGVAISRERMPLGICTSSGTVGHSLSLGKADSVTVLAPDTALADAVATRLGNEVGSEADIEPALSLARSIPGLLGAVIILGRQMGAWGEIELVRLD